MPWGRLMPPPEDNARPRGRQCPTNAPGGWALLELTDALRLFQSILRYPYR